MTPWDSPMKITNSVIIYLHPYKTCDFYSPLTSIVWTKICLVINILKIHFFVFSRKKRNAYRGM